MLKSLKIACLLCVTLFCTTAQAEEVVVLAKYKGGEITSVQVEQTFRSVLDSQDATKGKTFAQLDKNFQDALLKALLNSIVLEEEFKELKLESDAEFQTKLKNARTQLVQSSVLQKHLKNAINDKMIDEEYETLVQNLKGQKQVEVSHILVTSKEEAKKARQEIVDGKKAFAEVAKKYSKDEASAKNGGKIGFILRDQVPADFASKAFSLNKDQVSEPFQTQFGWHIIKVHGDKPATPPSKADAKSGILASLNENAVEVYLKKLYEKFDVKIEGDKNSDSKLDSKSDNKSDSKDAVQKEGGDKEKEAEKKSE